MWLFEFKVGEKKNYTYTIQTLDLFFKNIPREKNNMPRMNFDDKVW